MKKSFFETKEYLTFKKIENRLLEKKTLKNVIYYWKYLCLCLRVCDETYNRVGYDFKNSSYFWITTFKKTKEEYTSESSIEIIIEYGCDYDKMLSYLDNHERNNRN